MKALMKGLHQKKNGYSESKPFGHPQAPSKGDFFDCPFWKTYKTG
jgi:hypothetical protein